MLGFMNNFLSKLAEKLPGKAGAALGAKLQENLYKSYDFLPGGLTYSVLRIFPRPQGGGGVGVRVVGFPNQRTIMI